MRARPAARSYRYSLRASLAKPEYPLVSDIEEPDWTSVTWYEAKVVSVTKCVREVKFGSARGYVIDSTRAFGPRPVDHWGDASCLL